MKAGLEEYAALPLTVLNLAVCSSHVQCILWEKNNYLLMWFLTCCRGRPSQPCDPRIKAKIFEHHKNRFQTLSAYCEPISNAQNPYN